MAPKIQPLINPSLPIEIISKILSHLPVTDLTRFKTVCKPWFHLITSLYFSHQHFTSQPPHYDDRIVVFVGKDGCLYFSNLDVSDSFTPTKITIDDYMFKDIVGSCNGLILCACNNNNNNNNDDNDNDNDNDNDDDSEDSKRVCLVIVNPSTLQHKLISVNEVAASCGTHCYGFGYDFKEDDYKVVRIAKESTKSDLEKQSVNTKRTILLRGCEIRVYSLKTDSWRTIDQDFDGGFYFALSGVLVNNHMLHWLFYVFNGYVIRSFDVCTEQWSEVALPGFDLRGCPVNIMVFDDRLCLLTYKERSLYMMDEYGVRDSWVKLFDCPREIHCDNILPYPLIYSKSRSEILVVVGSRLFWFDLIKETCREIQGHDVFYFSARLVARLVMCTRSLVCLLGCGSIS